MKHLSKSIFFTYFQSVKLTKCVLLAACLMECELLIRSWRTLVSYSTELYFHLSLPDVSTWIDWGYELLGRVLQRWCALLKAHAQLLQSCLTLCYPMDCSPPGSSVHRILQARILEWVASPFFRDFPTHRSKMGLHGQVGFLLLWYQTST